MKKQRHPVIAILAGEARNKDSMHFCGDGAYFKQLQESIHKMGGLCYVMTPKTRKDESGFLYFPVLKKWAYAKVPKPDAVYVRIPARKEEDGEACRECLISLNEEGILCFNASFFHKWETWKTLFDVPALMPFLPQTALLTSSGQLLQWIQIYRSVYLKPASKSKGKGIMRITQTGSHYYMESIKEKKGPFLFNELLNECRPLFKEQTLLQQEIQTDLYEGKKYDLRVLSVFNGESYNLTGVGIRQSSSQSVTTHVPAGGRLVSAALLEDRIDSVVLEKLVQNIGAALSKQYGEIGEFSADIGRSSDGRYWIYEVNARPMTFDEKDIQSNRISQLTSLFAKTAANPNKFLKDSPSPSRI
ncbi:YheC/YheD family protein [Metabacillus sp. GX 13764]|uniref:YheC/YheD family endospore coat-associated protein n=1 Tax=Metabacillus kandeliae TaxID=2900151 RepID=UPI001E2A189E|nr:YheC/YheD family protein [Metabacillus kandeliae]MCD7034832.1 YheC/YheD family protein [Metabacillus kandeliae]